MERSHIILPERRLILPPRYAPEIETSRRRHGRAHGYLPTLREDLQMPLEAAVAKVGSSSHSTGAATAKVYNHTTHTVGAGSNLALLVRLVLVESDAAGSAVTVVWDPVTANQSMYQIATTATASSANVHIMLFGLVAPVTGNKTVRVTYAGTSNPSQVTVGAITLSGVDQTGTTTSFAHAITNTGTASGAGGVTITSAVNNWTMSVWANTGSGSHVTGHNQTEDFFDDTGSTCNVEVQDAAGAATVSHTVTINAVDDWGIAGCDVVAAGAAAGSLLTLGVRPMEGGMSDMSGGAV